MSGNNVQENGWWNLTHFKFKTAFFHQFNLNSLHQATSNKQQKKSLAKIRVAETIQC